MQEQHFKKINQYYFQKVVGSGAFGIVYLGWDDLFKRQVAIKEICISKLDLEQSQDQKQYEMIEKEIEICKKLKNRNIVELYDSFKADKYFYIIFEYCSKGDLEMLFKKNRFQENEVKAIFQQIIGGIKYLYNQKVVHRDIKLANIYINEQWIIKLGDFGFARNFDNQMQSYCGTPITMAPEIICGKGIYDEKCDIWSLGMILYIMIFGNSYLQQFITPKTSLKEFSEIVQKQEVLFPNRAQISEGLRDLISKMLIVDSKKRIGFEQLFEHYWIKEDENESLKKSIRFISKRMNSGLMSDIKVPLQLTINEQLSYEFGQYGIMRNKVIENIRDILNLCQSIANIKRLCENFLKKLRQSQNNYQITLTMRDQIKILKEGKTKNFDVKYKLIYLLLKIMLELIKTENVTMERLEKVQDLFELAQNINISNIIKIKIIKEDIQQMNEQELNQQLEQLGNELREIMIQQYSRQQQRPHNKEYEISFENRQLQEQTIMRLETVIDNYHLLRNEKI